MSAGLKCTSIEEDNCISRVEVECDPNLSPQENDIQFNECNDLNGKEEETPVLSFDSSEIKKEQEAGKLEFIDAILEKEAQEEEKQSDSYVKKLVQEEVVFPSEFIDCSVKWEIEGENEEEEEERSEFIEIPVRPEEILHAYSDADTPSTSSGKDVCFVTENGYSDITDVRIKEECDDGELFSSENQDINSRKLDSTFWFENDNEQQPGSSKKAFKMETVVVRNIGSSCNRCGIMYSSHVSLLKHQEQCNHPVPVPKKKNPPKKIYRRYTRYECHFCGRIFDKKDKFTRHIRSHTGEKPFSCDECGQRFSQKSDVNRHMITHTGDEKFKCEECGKTFTQGDNLKTHRRIHTGEKPFECGECGKKFRQNGNLKTHMRVHIGEKLFECVECRQGFTSSPLLKTHMVEEHPGKKPFECIMCKYSCYHMSALKLHMNIHLGEKPYECMECGYKCAKSSNLKIHMRIHSGEKPYICPHCEHGFTQSSSLKRHVQRYHVEPTNVLAS